MSDDFDRFLAQVEAQLRADIELQIEAARAKVRAYETVLRAKGELADRPPLRTEILLSTAEILRLPAPAAPASRPGDAGLPREGRAAGGNGEPGAAPAAARRETRSAGHERPRPAAPAVKGPRYASAAS